MSKPYPVYYMVIVNQNLWLFKKSVISDIYERIHDINLNVYIYIYMYMYIYIYIYIYIDIDIYIYRYIYI